jgi:hypothetical protein
VNKIITTLSDENNYPDKSCTSWEVMRLCNWQPFDLNQFTTKSDLNSGKDHFAVG